MYLLSSWRERKFSTDGLAKAQRHLSEIRTNKTSLEENLARWKNSTANLVAEIEKSREQHGKRLDDQFRAQNTLESAMESWRGLNATRDDLRNNRIPSAKNFTSTCEGWVAGNETAVEGEKAAQKKWEAKKLEAAGMMKEANEKAVEAKKFLEENAKKVRLLEAKMVGTREKIGFYDAELKENNQTMTADVKNAVEEWYGVSLHS